MKNVVMRAKSIAFLLSRGWGGLWQRLPFVSLLIAARWALNRVEDDGQWHAQKFLFCSDGTLSGSKLANVLLTFLLFWLTPTISYRDACMLQCLHTFAHTVINYFYFQFFLDCVRQTRTRIVDVVSIELTIDDNRLIIDITILGVTLTGEWQSAN